MDEPVSIALEWCGTDVPLQSRSRLDRDIRVGCGVCEGGGRHLPFAGKVGMEVSSLRTSGDVGVKGYILTCPCTSTAFCRLSDPHPASWDASRYVGSLSMEDSGPSPIPKNSQAPLSCLQS